MARQAKKTAKCVRCGGRLERFDQDDRIIMDWSVKVQQTSPCLHRRDNVVAHDWYSNSQVTVRSWRMCERCARGAEEALMDYVESGIVQQRMLINGN